MYFIIASLNFGLIVLSLVVSYYKNPEKRHKFVINLLNWIIIFLPNFYFVNYNFKINENNSFLTVIFVSILHFIIWNIVLEIYFYWSHRIIHEIPFLYRKIHKQHHNSVPICVLDAQWANPIETLIIVVPSYWLWPFISEILFGNCLTNQVLIIMSLLSSFDSIKNHISQNNFHIRHHINPKYNFGTIGIFDWIFKTHFDE